MTSWEHVLKNCSTQIPRLLKIKYRNYDFKFKARGISGLKILFLRNALFLFSKWYMCMIITYVTASRINRYLTMTFVFSSVSNLLWNCSRCLVQEGKIYYIKNFLSSPDTTYLTTFVLYFRNIVRQFLEKYFLNKQINNISKSCRL